MMKKAFYWSASVLTAALAAAAPASAADMYGAAGGYKDGPVYANTWTGFYLGGHLGAAWGRDKVTDLDGFNVQGEVIKNNSGASGVYGLQSGYNWQSGNIVFGVEVDLGAMDLNHQQNNQDNILTGLASLNSGIYGDVTGRLGYAFGSALIYAKGGFAFFDGKANMNGFQGPMKDTSAFAGWTLGGGLEYALTPAWSLKAEYQRFDFGSENSTTSSGDICSTCRFSHDLTVDTVKLGMNYHFGHGYEPLK
jgi:opacity protein-like surface antigen